MSVSNHEFNFLNPENWELIHRILNSNNVSPIFYPSGNSLNENQENNSLQDDQSINLSIYTTINQIDQTARHDSNHTTRKRKQEKSDLKVNNKKEKYPSSDEKSNNNYNYSNSNHNYNNNNSNSNHNHHDLERDFADGSSDIVMGFTGDHESPNTHSNHHSSSPKPSSFIENIAKRELKQSNKSKRKSNSNQKRVQQCQDNREITYTQNTVSNLTELSKEVRQIALDVYNKTNSKKSNSNFTFKDIDPTDEILEVVTHISPLVPVSIDLIKRISSLLLVLKTPYERQVVTQAMNAIPLKDRVELIVLIAPLAIGLRIAKDRVKCLNNASKYSANDRKELPVVFEDFQSPRCPTLFGKLLADGTSIELMKALVNLSRAFPESRKNRWMQYLAPHLVELSQLTFWGAGAKQNGFEFLDQLLQHIPKDHWEEALRFIRSETGQSLENKLLLLSRFKDIPKRKKDLLLKIAIRGSVRESFINGSMTVKGMSEFLPQLEALSFEELNKINNMCGFSTYACFSYSLFPFLLEFSHEQRTLLDEYFSFLCDSGLSHTPPRHLPQIGKAIFSAPLPEQKDILQKAKALYNELYRHHRNHNKSFPHDRLSLDGIILALTQTLAEDRSDLIQSYLSLSSLFLKERSGNVKEALLILSRIPKDHRRNAIQNALNLWNDQQEFLPILEFTGKVSNEECKKLSLKASEILSLSTFSSSDKVSDVKNFNLCGEFLEAIRKIPFEEIDTLISTIQTFYLPTTIHIDGKELIGLLGLSTLYPKENFSELLHYLATYFTHSIPSDFINYIKNLLPKERNTAFELLIELKGSDKIIPLLKLLELIPEDERDETKKILVTEFCQKVEWEKVISSVRSLPENHRGMIIREIVSAIGNNSEADPTPRLTCFIQGFSLASSISIADQTIDHYRALFYLMASFNLCQLQQFIYDLQKLEDSQKRAFLALEPKHPQQIMKLWDILKKFGNSSNGINRSIQVLNLLKTRSWEDQVDLIERSQLLFKTFDRELRLDIMNGIAEIPIEDREDVIRRTHPFFEKDLSPSAMLVEIASISPEKRDQILEKSKPYFEKFRFPEFYHLILRIIAHNKSKFLDQIPDLINEDHQFPQHLVGSFTRMIFVSTFYFHLSGFKKFLKALRKKFTSKERERIKEVKVFKSILQKKPELNQEMHDHLNHVLQTATDQKVIRDIVDQILPQHLIEIFNPSLVQEAQNKLARINSRAQPNAGANSNVDANAEGKRNI